MKSKSKSKAKKYHALMTFLVILFVIVDAFLLGYHIQQESLQNKIEITNYSSSTSGIKKQIDQLPTSMVTEEALGEMKTYKGIVYNPELGGPTDEKVLIVSLVERYGEDTPITGWFKTKLSPSGKEYYIIQDGGPSGDPHFEFYVKENGKFTEAGYTPTGLVIPGNGLLYTKSHVNEYFESYRKFKEHEGKIVEVVQPLLYVGLKTKTAATIRLFSQDDRETVAIVATGTPIEVVLRDEMEPTRYLIKTQKGILGWMYDKDIKSTQCRYEGGEYISTDGTIEDFCFAGD